MKKAAVIGLLFAAGCTGGHRAANTGDQAMAYKAVTYSLGRVPDSAREQLFYDTVDAAYSEAAKKMGAGSTSGFSYSLTPRGAVYPFSEVDVACVLRGSGADEYGARLCPVFFRALEAQFKKAFKGE